MVQEMYLQIFRQAVGLEEVGWWGLIQILNSEFMTQQLEQIG